MSTEANSSSRENTNARAKPPLMSLRRAERGNMFMALFGAVAVVGVLGATIMSVMRGPLSTMVEVNRREQAKSEVQLAANLILTSADDYEDPDDGFTEPPAAPNYDNATGRGTLPSVGATMNDPWGTPYAYCGWNHGPDAAGQTGLSGLNTGSSDTNNIAIAVISAGPDRNFNTTCEDHAGGYVDPDGGGGDDIVRAMSYADAIAATGGLWEPVGADEATIARNLTVTSPNESSFGGSLRINNASAAMITDRLEPISPGSLSYVTIGDSSAQYGLRLGDVADGQCAGTSGILRYNSSGELELCDGTSFEPIAGLWKKIGATDDIFYGVGDVIIGASTDPSYKLEVAGTLGASDAVTFGSTLDVAGDFDIGAGDFTVNATNGNTAIGGTLDVTGAADLGSTLDVADTLSVNGGGIIVNKGASKVFEVDSDGNIWGQDTDIDGVLTVMGPAASGDTLVLDVQNNAAATVFSVDHDGDVTLGALSQLKLSDNTDRNILVSDGTSFKSVAMSGDATIANNGDLTIEDNAITKVKLADGVVDRAKLDGGSATSGQCLKAGTGDTVLWQDCSAGGGGDGVGSAVFGDLNDVTFTSLTANDCVYYKDATDEWVNVPCSSLPGAVSKIDDLIDAKYQTTTDFNLFIGHEGGSAGSNSQYNIGIGQNALDSLTNTPAGGNGDYNIALGYNALTKTTAGSNNTAIGYESGKEITGARGNTAVGRSSLTNNQGGWGNTAIGSDAMGNQGNIGDLQYNTAVGKSAGISMQAGADRNTLVGNNAGHNITTGDRNIMIGDTVNPPTNTTNEYLNIGGILLGDLGITSLDPRIGSYKYCDETLTDCFTVDDLDNAGIWQEDGTNDYIEYDDTLGGVRIASVTGQPAPIVDWTLDSANSLVYTSNDVAIGSAAVSGTLLLDVEGALGAAQYCDENGANCKSITELGAPKLNTLLAADGTATINNAANAIVWNWNSLTTETGLQLSSSSATSGSPLKVSTYNTAASYGALVATTASTSSGGAGIVGHANGATGSTYGIIGRSDSTSGRGVYGNTTAATGNTYGVYGRSDSSTGRGVLGWASSTSGINYGVQAYSDSASGRGVYGYTTSATGTNYGVYGASASDAGFGGYFENSSTGWGLYSADNVGIAAGSYLNWGATMGNTGYGIRDNAGVIECKNSGGSWAACGGTGTATNLPLSGITAATATNTIDNAAYAQVWNWNSITNTYGLTIASSSVTAGAPLQTLNTNTTGSGRGLYAENRSSGSSSAAIYAHSKATTGSNYGVIGRNTSDSGSGIYGWADSSTGTNTGVYGTSTSSSGRGVLGYATSTSGITYGLFGRVDSPDGLAVYGFNAATTGSAIGVRGQSSSATGRGVNARADAASGINYGLYATSASDTGYGGYFDNTNVSPGWALYSAQNVGIAAGKYLNWGTTQGNTGYGIRDNAGVIECKNSGGSWAACGGTGVATSLPLSGITAATATNTIDNAAYAQVWNWNSLTTETALTLASSSLTSGSLLKVTNTNASATGNLLSITSNATSAGHNLLNISNSATSGAHETLRVSNSSNTDFAIAIYGISNASSGNTYGVWGQTNSSLGSGVHGYSGNGGASSGSGVYGHSAGQLGRGVRGLASHTSGVNYGIHGQSNSAAGYGGFFNNSAGGWGLFSNADAGIAAGKYLNWGTTQGNTGYGIRDNAGVIECKNSGGSWAACQGVASGSLFIDDLGDAIHSGESLHLGSGSGTNDDLSNNGNVTVGQNSSNAITTQTGNVVLGSFSNQNHTGENNLVFGNNALNGTGNGSGNMALGHYSLGKLTSGYNNIGIGPGSLIEITDGVGNLAIGNDAGHGASGGATSSNNTLIGHSAGLAINGAESNIFIGNQAGSTMTSGDNNILIGNSTAASAVTASNELNIGNTIYGDLSAGNIRLAAGKYFNFGATLGTSGYGIRDNAGVIECKDSGGSWAPCSTDNSLDIVTGQPAPNAINLANLGDVDTAGATNGNCLTYNAGTWEDGACGGGGSLWTDLTGGRIHYGDDGTVQVGIGTDDPGYTLDIRGQTRITAGWDGGLLVTSGSAGYPHVLVGSDYGSGGSVQFASGQSSAVFDTRIHRTDAKTLTVDDNAGTDVAFNIIGDLNVSNKINIAGQAGNAPVSASGGGSAALSSITAATTTATINNADNSIVWNWNSLTTGKGLTLGSSSLTSGNILSVENTNASSTGAALSLSTNSTDASSTALTVTHSGFAASLATNAIFAETKAYIGPGSAVYGLASTNNGGSSAIGVTGESQSQHGVGIKGLTSGTGTGARAGWFAATSAGANANYGVYTTNASTGAGYGLFSRMSGSGNSGYAGYFENTATSGINYGVYSKIATSSNTATAVYGEATSTGSFVTIGVQGRSSSANGRGVWGYALSTTGGSSGVLGQNASTTGYGGYFMNTASSGASYGLFSSNASASGYGGYFTNTNGGWGLFSNADVGIAAGKYLNWGTTLGETGYGIRDNAGVIECKNSGGSWAACAGGGAALSSITAATTTNSINNGANPQTWNWQLNASNQYGLGIKESAASTNGGGTQALFGVGTLANSTAIAMAIENLGNAHSLLVADSPTDTSPFVIDASGNVGIKTLSPTYDLEITDSASNVLVNSTNTTTGISTLGLRAGTATSVVRLFPQSHASKANRMEVGLTGGNGDLAFLTNNGIDRMVLTNSGKVQINGDIEYTGVMTDTSDRRLKTDIAPLDTDSMIEKLAQVDTYSFRMKDDPEGPLEYGVMAQELEEIFPDLVFTAEDEMGTKSVNYMGLIAPMIEATKTLKSENETLKADLANLKSGQDELGKQVELLNKAMAGNIGKASILPTNLSWLYALLGLIAGIGVTVLALRKFKPA